MSTVDALNTNQDESGMNIVNYNCKQDLKNVNEVVLVPEVDLGDHRHGHEVHDNAEVGHVTHQNDWHEKAKKMHSMKCRSCPSSRC